MRSVAIAEVSPVLEALAALGLLTFSFPEVEPEEVVRLFWLGLAAFEADLACCLGLLGGFFALSSWLILLPDVDLFLRSIAIGRPGCSGTFAAASGSFAFAGGR